MPTKKTASKEATNARPTTPATQSPTGPIRHDPYEWIATTSIRSSDDLEVPERLLDQVIGQDQAVAVAEKATQQKRNLLLIGDPGTGKSMIAKAMKEMLPPERLKDVLAYHNPADPNSPKILTTEPGEGRAVVRRMRRIARRKKVVRKTIEWLLITAVLVLGVLPMIINPWETVSIMVLGIMILVAAFLFTVFKQGKDAVVFSVPKIMQEYDPKSENHTMYVDATGGHAGALLGDVRHDPFQSGGLETPPHERVEVGAIHKAHKGILFIDEINVLRLDSQQALLTAMQDRLYSIVGQSETSSGAMVKTDPVPCDFILVAAGNLDAVREPDGIHTGMHPALRSRIRGYGYEVYVNSTMDDTHENRLKLCRFVAQEIRNDGRIARFDAEAVAEVILEGQRRSGHRGKLTLRLRELGGLVRTAGDVARARGRDEVTAEDVREAKRLSRSLEQQIAEQRLEERRTQDVGAGQGDLVGFAPGAGLVGTGAVGEPAGLVVPITAAVTSPLSRHNGHIAFGGGLETSAKGQTEIVQTLLKKLGGTDAADRDIHVQSVIGQDEMDATACGLAMAVSALSALEGVAVRQDTVLAAAMTVTGKMRAVAGITQVIESAVDAGHTRVVVAESNRNDIMLNPVYRQRVEIVYAHELAGVLADVLMGPRKKEVLQRVQEAGLTNGLARLVERKTAPRARKRA